MTERLGCFFGTVDAIRSPKMDQTMRTGRQVAEGIGGQKNGDPAASVSVVFEAEPSLGEQEFGTENAVRHFHFLLRCVQ
jgi:hypothetical protein